MKKLVYPLAMALAMFSLSGCGLKGPLYFPPADNKTPESVEKPVSSEQSATPDQNDRGDGDDPTQVVTQ
ncbi:LPS translocon maturation chaperone LptM [Mangrovibacter yixingensis]|uniref:LPS translocon maturation chaperone LptM n=1 Tax=Mangrovibacter yixingensis TaxID=1529639 RepID=UPI001CFEF3F6|nr:lipoprotein [Mangrovibacter yixingensis]